MEYLIISLFLSFKLLFLEPVRVHHTSESYLKVKSNGLFPDQGLSGADILVGNQAIRKAFPYLGPNVQRLLHARRAGWLSGQQYAAYLFDLCKESRRFQFLRGTLDQVDQSDGRVSGVKIRTPSGSVESLKTSTFVNCCGPWIQTANEILGAPRLPIFNELHGKTIFIGKAAEAFPQDAPMVEKKD